MNFFFVADSATGAGMRSGHCAHADDVKLQANHAGEIVIATDRLYAVNSHRLDLSQTPPVVVAL